MSYRRMAHGVLAGVPLGACAAADSLVAFQTDFALVSDSPLGAAVGDGGVTQVVGRSCLALCAGGTAA